MIGTLAPGACPHPALPSPAMLPNFAHPLAVLARALGQGMVGLPSLSHLDSCLNVSILTLTFGALERDKHYAFLLQAVESQWNIVDDSFTETTDDLKESVEAQGKNTGKVGAEAWGDHIPSLRLEGITEPWKEIPWAAEPYGEQGEGRVVR